MRAVERDERAILGGCDAEGAAYGGEEGRAERVDARKYLETPTAGSNRPYARHVGSDSGLHAAPPPPRRTASVRCADLCLTA
jgi:hypothetical protein